MDYYKQREISLTNEFRKEIDFKHTDYYVCPTWTYRIHLQNCRSWTKFVVFCWSFFPSIHYDCHLGCYVC